ncbi:MAG: flagellar basal body rod protein FlgC [Proteobacteria bacterium]|nr:MAG: flagellar basal body rod protein FlgC [Pseudomonadota bacterium]
MSVSRIGDIAVSGLLAQRVRMTVTASNIANAHTTRTAEGGPYRRRDPVFEAQPAGGSFAAGLDRELSVVTVPRVEVDPRPGSMRLDPGHPDADENGYVRMPNVDLVEEMTNLMQASRSFEANLLSLRKAREMSDAALRIGK